MAKKKNKKNEKARNIVLLIVAIVSVVVSIAMNISGMKSAINKEKDSSGMVGFTSKINPSNTTNETKKSNSNSNNKNQVTGRDILVDAVPIVRLMGGNWDKIDSKFTGYVQDANGDAIFSDGYKFYCINGKYVNCVVFDTNYKKEVIAHLTVGTDFKTVKKILGEPDYKIGDGIGYKSKQVYIFFYNDKIVIYPNRDFNDKSKFENMINDYSNKTYTDGRTSFAVYFKRNFEDFEYTLDEETDTIILKSVSRQVILKLDNLGNIEVELYSGFIYKNDETEEKIKNKRYLKNNDDLVEITEKERVNGN